MQKNQTRREALTQTVALTLHTVPTLRIGQGLVLSSSILHSQVQASVLLSIGTSLLTAFFSLWQTRIEHRAKVELGTIEAEVRARIRQLELEFEYFKFQLPMGSYGDVTANGALDRGRRPLTQQVASNLDGGGTEFSLNQGAINVKRGKYGGIITPTEGTMFGNLSRATNSPIAVPTRDYYEGIPDSAKTAALVKMYDALPASNRPTEEEFSRTAKPIAVRGYSRASATNITTSGTDIDVIAAINNATYSNSSSKNRTTQRTDIDFYLTSKKS